MFLLVSPFRLDGFTLHRLQVVINPYTLMITARVQFRRYRKMICGCCERKKEMSTKILRGENSHEKKVKQNKTSCERRIGMKKCWLSWLLQMHVSVCLSYHVAISGCWGVKGY